MSIRKNDLGGFYIGPPDPEVNERKIPRCIHCGYAQPGNHADDCPARLMIQPFTDQMAEHVARLADVSLTVNGTWDALVDDGPIPFAYFSPPFRRGWWRGVEVIEYAGPVNRSAIKPDGSVEFRAAGALTRTAHRFWLKWTANRWLRRRRRA